MMPPLTFPAASLTPATYVVDTNVILVANGQHPDVSPACVTACQDWLQRIMAEGRVALDDAYAIVGEYQHKTHASDGQGVGDAFVRWVLQHVDDAARCDLVKLSPDAGRGFGRSQRADPLSVPSRGPGISSPQVRLLTHPL